MLAEMPSELLDEWAAADQLDQLLGRDKLYNVLALIGCALVNSWGGKTKPENFIPEYKPAGGGKGRTAAEASEEKPMSPNMAAAMFKLQAGRLGWTVN